MGVCRNARGMARPAGPWRHTGSHGVTVPVWRVWQRARACVCMCWALLCVRVRAAWQSRRCVAWCGCPAEGGKGGHIARALGLWRI